MGTGTEVDGEIEADAEPERNKDVEGAEVEDKSPIDGAMLAAACAGGNVISMSFWAEVG